jgi:hypothetical protein
MVASPLFQLGWPVNIAQPVLQNMPSSSSGRGGATRRCAIAGAALGTALASPAFFTSAVCRALQWKEKTMTRFLALIAATLLALAAQAGDTKDKTHDMKSTATFDALDKNADSQISKTEASADSKLSDNFAALDTNGDGYLSKAEFMAAKSKS